MTEELPGWLQRLIAKTRAKMSGLQDPPADASDPMFSTPSSEQIAEIRAADLALEQARREKWRKAFIEGPPLTFERDLIGINPVFLAWLAGQEPTVSQDIAAYWATEAQPHEGISHASERGQHARMTMVIHYAAEQYGYEV